MNIKLGSVASNIVGKSRRAILERRAHGSGNPDQLAGMALGHLRKKTPDLILALDGRQDEQFPWTLKRLLNNLRSQDAELAEIDARLCGKYGEQVDLLHRLFMIPGLYQTIARVLLAELGTDMSQFPMSAHAASWAGLCSGNSESGGKRFPGENSEGRLVPEPHPDPECMGRTA